MTNDLVEYLRKSLNLNPNHIKKIDLVHQNTGTIVIPSIVVDLVGVNVFELDKIKKIDGLSLITPNQLVITVGEIHL